MFDECQLLYGHVIQLRIERPGSYEIPELADSKYDYMYVWAMFYKRSESCTCIGTQKPCCVALGGVRNTQRPISALPWTGSRTSILVTHRAGGKRGIINGV